MQFKLLYKTTSDWTDTVINHFDLFLVDHAACERKASSMAMSMVAHYPDRHKLVSAMVDLAVEEMVHFKQVMQHILARNLVLPPDEKDPYVNQLRSHIRKERDAYFLDRLLLASIIEKRGAERFKLVADALTELNHPLKSFYSAIAKSEDRHYTLFLLLAEHYFSQDEITLRLATLLTMEAEIIKALPLRAALH